MSPSMEHPFSRSMNAASSPLPLVPRRAPSASRTHSVRSFVTPNNMSDSLLQVTIQPSSPPQEGLQPSTSISTDSDSSSSSCHSDGSRLTIRPKRIRGVRPPALCPPELSTPTPCVHYTRIAQEQRQEQASSISAGKYDDVTPRPTRPLMYCPGVPLRLPAEGHKARHSSESPAGSSSADNSQPRLIRKKSGQLVKPSLKVSKFRDSPAVLTRGGASKSEPNTPTHAKNVHFDSKLEHVKLFLSEQKPLAVSRDGSPTEDTSGTDSDFPSFVFGNSEATKSGKRIIMQLHNMPSIVDLNADVALEELVLSPNSTCILGKVRLRNIAYAKRLAVRFTFDSWQTTSEVTGKYVEAINDDFDRFSFSIRLNDLLARIEGKTLYMALRYTVAGREFWDNNRGNNYFAEFSKVPLNTKSKSSDGEKSAGSAIADLRSKLEQVASAEEKTDPTFLAQSSSNNVLMGTASLAARYDFGISLKEPWKPVDFTTPSPPRHIRTRSYPVTATPNSIPWPEKVRTRGVGMPTAPTLGSPREIDDDALFSGPPVAADLGGPSFPALLTRRHRRGYFDDSFVVAGSLVRRTSPGTPRMPSFDDLTPVPRFHSFPPIESARSPTPLGLGVTPASTYSDSCSSTDESTPSLTSPSSSSSRSSTPSPTDTFFMNSLMGMNDNVEQPASPNTNYRQFLSRFCFFTGSEGTPLNFARTQSASEIEEFLTSSSPRLASYATHAPPPRSPSLDDIIRGVATPTAPTAPKVSPAVSESLPTTPVSA